MADLKTDYVNDVLNTDVNTERTYNIVDANGNLIYEGIKLRETTALSEVGDTYGALEINEQNETINQINADITQINHDLPDGLATKVSKSGDTITGNLTVNGTLQGSGINVALHNALVGTNGTNADWRNCANGTDGWYHYEGANVTTYGLPYTHCIVHVHKSTAGRGNAIAYRWDNGIPMVWFNTLHDTWRGWRAIGSNYNVLKASATYTGNNNVVTFAESLLNYSKLAITLFNGEQAGDYIEIPVRRFLAGNYFVVSDKTQNARYALIARNSSNLNNSVVITGTSNSPIIQIEGVY